MGEDDVSANLPYQSGTDCTQKCNPSLCCVKALVGAPLQEIKQAADHVRQNELSNAALRPEQSVAHQTINGSGRPGYPKRLMRITGFGLRVFLPAVICFVVTNITNGTLLPILAKHHLLYASNASTDASSEKTLLFFADPMKSAMYFIASAFLLSR